MDTVIGVVLVVSFLAAGYFLTRRKSAPKDPGGNGAGGKDSKAK